MVREIAPCLWFDGVADEAVDHYVSIFPNSTRTSASDFNPEAPGPRGSSLVVHFELDGRPFIALNGGPGFPFTEAVSLTVHCESQDEVDYYWDHLIDGGRASRCGWLQDRFGLSWQVVPLRLLELFSDPDRERADRAFRKMMTMVKLNISELEAAADGDSPQ